MPRLKCADNISIEKDGKDVSAYMHPVRIERYFKDSDGCWHPRYRVYECDCGKTHVLDVERNVWGHEVPKE